MKVHCLLLTSPFRPNIGGVETHLDDLINAGTKRGVSFTVVTYMPLVTPAKADFREVGTGYSIYRLPWPRLNLFLRLEKLPALEFMYLFPGIFIGGLIYLLLKSSTVSAIHAQGLAAGAAGIFLGLLFRKKVLISTHSIYNFPEKGLYRNFVKFLFSKTKGILTLSKQSKREVNRLGIPQSKIHIFTYWVDQTLFKPKDQKLSGKKVKLPEGKFICLFVGRLVAVKGLQELMEAAKLTCKEILFVIAGSGPMENEILAFISRNKNCIFVGPLNKNQLVNYYNAADVLIIPSTHEEGFGRVIIEALSCGTPVIGSKRGAIPEVITDDVGVLINISKKTIKDTVENLWKDPSKLTKLASNARGYAKRNYSEDNVRQIIKYYY